MPTPEQIKDRIEKLTKTQRLVHLVYRKTADDISDTYEVLFDIGRRTYEQALTSMAAQVGCGNRFAHLSDGLILKELSELYYSHAASIVATYNFDLAGAIQSIYSENKYANRYYYAKRLDEWEKLRSSWKDDQILQMTIAYAKDMAVRDFARFNLTDGYGIFEGPDDSITCDACKSLIDGNPYSLEDFAKISCPVHVNCRHNKAIYAGKFDNVACEELWLGGVGKLSDGDAGIVKLSDELRQRDWLDIYSEFGNQAYADILSLKDAYDVSKGIDFSRRWGLSRGVYSGFVWKSSENYTIIDEVQRTVLPYSVVVKLMNPFVTLRVWDVSRKYSELKQACEDLSWDEIGRYLAQLGYDSLSLIENDDRRIVYFGRSQNLRFFLGKSA